MSEQIDNTSTGESNYFSLQASWGITNHIGGLRATGKLIQLCRIQPDDNVLVIGSGSGKTAVHLVRKHRCRITCIDISRDMVELAARRAIKEGITDRAGFIVADAQELPFENGEFDAVICESVNSFIPDRPKAMREYARVVKPGKYVGMNEVTWLKPPTPGVADYFIKSMGARPLEAAGWRSLMEDGGLKDVTGQLFRPNILTMWYDELAQTGPADALRGWGKFFRMMFQGSPEVRQYMKDLWPPPWNILNYMGYGLYTGRG